MIYLASPYTDHGPFKLVREDYRWRAAVLAAIKLSNERHTAVFSPIAHSHHMHIWSGGTIGGDWKQWAEFDRAIIAACSEFVILRLKGWEQSEGIKHEEIIALDLGIPVTHMDWSTEDMNADAQSAG